jgi:hypothetical protein
MLVCFWSPKGGSGTSVVTAAAALVVARTMPARLVDLDGDQPAVLGLGREPAQGLRDWLRAGPQAPTEALEHLAVPVAPGLDLLPAGEAAPDAGVPPEAGAALAVALDVDPRPALCDLGRLDTQAHEAFAEVAGPSVVVVRGCYLALRRAVNHPAIRDTEGAIFVDEHGRSLGARDVEDVLGIPVLATITTRTSTARAVDAGILPARLPESLARPLQLALSRSGWFDDEQAA